MKPYSLFQSFALTSSPPLMHIKNDLNIHRCQLKSNRFCEKPNKNGFFVRIERVSHVNFTRQNRWNKVNIIHNTKNNLNRLYTQAPDTMARVSTFNNEPSKPTKEYVLGVFYLVSFFPPSPPSTPPPLTQLAWIMKEKHVAIKAKKLFRTSMPY